MPCSCERECAWRACRLALNSASAAASSAWQACRLGVDFVRAAARNFLQILRLVDSLLSNQFGLPFTGGGRRAYKSSTRRLLAVDSLCAALYRRKSMSLQSVDSSTPCCQLTFGCPLTADIHESAICRLVDSLLSTRSGLPFTGGNVTVYKLSTRRLAAAASQIQALYRD